MFGAVKVKVESDKKYCFLTDCVSLSENVVGRIKPQIPPQINGTCNKACQLEARRALMNKRRTRRRNSQSNRIFQFS